MKKLLGAINEVRKLTGAVHKNGKNTFHNYSYATASDVIAEVREQMNAQGLIVWPKLVKDLALLKNDTVAEGTITFVVAHADSGEQMEVDIRAAGEDKGDKRPYKMNTGALKYLLIQLFLLPTDDDPEKHDHKNEDKKPGTNGTNGQTNGTPAGKDVPEKAWLNKGTKEWDNAIGSLATGAKTPGGKDITVSMICTKYKVRKEDKALLEAAEKKGKEVAV